ncbi:MAG TPA: hypothetical protein VMU47_11635 [Caldimonas sp.]|nr:hypothetical protein [Caldimonas sp.]
MDPSSGFQDAFRARQTAQPLLESAQARLELGSCRNVHGACEQHPHALDPVLDERDLCGLAIHG